MSCRIGPIQCLLVYVTILLPTFGYGMSVNTSAEFQMQASPLLTASYKVWEINKGTENSLFLGESLGGPVQIQNFHQNDMKSICSRSQ